MIIPLGLGKKLSFVAAVLLLPQLACAGSFKLGSVSTSPVAETNKFWPLASYLARQLQTEGINQGKVVVAESIPAMSSFLQTRQVDLYIDSFFPSMAVSRLSGSKLLLRRWKTGKSEYRSVIFTRKDGGIARLKDLKGKVIAFEEPFGSAGYFFPKMVLLEKGFRLAPKRRGIDPVKSDEVGYIFSHSDSQTIFLVLNGVVAAGATDDQKYLILAKSLGTFKVIHETASFPRQIVSYRADLPANLVTRVKEVLLHMHQTEKGRQVLRAFESTTKFEEIPVRDIELVAGLRKYVDAELKLQR
ncbi:MAG: phosphate/phosphite/phosphonate ABC transporter substrate-binding protein [Candidatus Binatia bacterium]